MSLGAAVCVVMVLNYRISSALLMIDYQIAFTAKIGRRSL